MTFCSASVYTVLRRVLRPKIYRRLYQVVQVVVVVAAAGYLQLLQQLLQAQTTSLPVTIPMKSVLPAFLSVILTARASVLSGNSKILLKICESGGIL